MQFATYQFLAVRNSMDICYTFPCSVVVKSLVKSGLAFVLGSLLDTLIFLLLCDKYPTRLCVVLLCFEFCCKQN